MVWGTFFIQAQLILNEQFEPSSIKLINQLDFA